MPTTRLINQPWDGRGQRLGDLIVTKLTQKAPRFELFRVCVAYIKASGMLQLLPSLQTFINRGGRVEIVVGIDERITTKQGLELAMRHSTTTHVFSNPGTTFHPKVYLFEIPGRTGVALIGSGNLTAGGLYTNYEAAIEIECDLTVPADRATYDRISEAFLKASDTRVGNARLLDSALLAELFRTSRIVDEGQQRRTRRQILRGRARDSAVPLFPRTPVPPAPPIDPSLRGLIPRIQATRDFEAREEAVTAFQPWTTFAMVLGSRDTRQQSGYSREVFIPLAARDFNREFWGWPRLFQPGSSSTVGRYLQRRIDMLVRPANGPAQLVEGVRLYYYKVKHEFRLNCGRLVEGAAAGDLLVIQRSPVGASFRGRTYEYQATVISTLHPMYGTFARECRSVVSGSTKKWGYLA